METSFEHVGPVDFMLVAAAIVGAAFMLLAGMALVSERFLTRPGPVRIVVNGEKNVLSQTGVTLRDALRNGGIFLPGTCGSLASCGLCRITMLDPPRALPTEKCVLSAVEIAGGVRLACQHRLKRDVEIRVPDRLLAAVGLTLTLIETTKANADVRRLQFDVSDAGNFSFRAGQYLQLEIPHPSAGTVYRAYSIASDPRRPTRIDLYVKKVPGGWASGYLHRLRPEDQLRATGPFGEFCVPDDTDATLITGGIGIAPAFAIVPEFRARTGGRRLTLLAGAAKNADGFYRRTFGELALRSENFSFEFAADEGSATGRFALAKIVSGRISGSAPVGIFMISGPEKMALAIRSLLLEKGVSPDRILCDRHM